MRKQVFLVDDVVMCHSGGIVVLLVKKTWGGKS